MRVAAPPSTGTLYMAQIDVFHWSRLDRKTTDFESGVQVTTMSSGPCRPPVPGSVGGWKVSRRAAPPPEGITQMSVPALLTSVYAIQRPSGDTRGNRSWPGALVRRKAVPPALGTDQRLPSATKTMLSPNG